MKNTSLKILQTFEKNQFCKFCNTNLVDTLAYGPIYQYEQIITHYFCLLLSSNIMQNGKDDEGILGFLSRDIEKEVARGKRLTCSYCRKKGALIGCAVKSCRTMFHLPCGIKSRALNLFYDNYRSYCQKHRTWPDIPNFEENPIDKQACPICMEVLSLPQSNITWSTCCKNAWYHKRCIQEVALNSGYYFRCPNCNNDKLFRKQMLEFGVYIPDQDASWEREPNAFSSQYERYNRCDAMICYCPNGREICNREGSWQIILCYRCLQKGVHKRCGTGILENNLWSCSDQACLDGNSAKMVSTPRTSGITTRSSTLLTSNKSENKENIDFDCNTDNLPNGVSSLFHRRTAEVLNNSFASNHRRTRFASILFSNRASFTHPEINGNSFAFNLPPVNTINSSVVHILRRKRRNLRYRSDKPDEKSKRPQSKMKLRPRKRRKQSKKADKIDHFGKNSRKPCKSVDCQFFKGRFFKRRKYVINGYTVRVYPAIAERLKYFEISL